ncbi:MAG: rRNA pseudouridine synthase [Rikenellaceae bacterium]|nr:rRNA pseudouridine synthase [Rikenellaceae bacterium]
MRDFKNDSTLARFGRDKRERTTTKVAERVERRERPMRDHAEAVSHTPRTKRASFNPHFTEDNRPNFEKPQRNYGDRPAYGDRAKKFAGRGDHAERAGRTERTFDHAERPAYGAKRSAAGKSFGGKKRSFVREEKPKSYPKYNPNKQVGEMRLNRYVAQSGICSRREADDFIAAGLVSVNGVIVTELGTKVMPGDVVKFNDTKLQGEQKVYLVLNKPKGYVTSLDDPHAEKTVMELVKGACTERIYPVGRLDKNSLGLLLFTNDGDLTKQLSHPAHAKKKIYQVSLDKPLTRADMDRIAEGIVLEDGEIHADEISYASENKKEVGIEIHSGRNRIVRRIFEMLGYSVQKLDRVYYAGLTKKNLKRGQWRFLTREEVERLKSGRYE